MEIGKILYDYQNNKKMGVIVYPLEDRYILFKLDNNTYPIFSRLPKSEISGLATNGNINQTENQNLKMHLLKYYRKHNLSSSEKKLLTPLMNYAYPNGIPEYSTTTANTDEELLQMNLHNKLKCGNKFHINTVHNSPFEYMNELQVYIININENGIWVGFQDNNDLKLSYLPYSVKSQPTFHGISKLIPLDTNNSSNDILYTKLQNEYSTRLANNVLYTTIHHNDQHFKIDTKGNIISLNNPKYKNSIYDFNKCQVLQHHNMNGTTIQCINVLTNDNELPTDYFKSKTITTKKLTTGDDVILTVGNEFIHDEYPIKQTGGEIMNNEQTIELSDETLEELKEVDNAFIKDYSDNSDNEINIDNGNETLIQSDESNLELDIIESGFEILDTVDKVQQKPVPELEKVLDESIQMSNIRKYKIEKIPRHLRANARLFDKLTNKIQKDVNIISFMKAMTTNSDNTISYFNNDYKPLVEQYTDYNYQNKFLTPLIVSNKRIYLRPDDKLRDFDNSIIEDNLLTIFKEINKASLTNKKRIINYKDDVNKMVNIFNPHPEYTLKPTGIKVVFGEGLTTKEEQYLKYLENNSSLDNITHKTENMNSIKLESISAQLKINRIQQDTEVIRFGLQKDAEIAQFSGNWLDIKSYENEKMMGPLVYYKEPGQIDLAILENRIDRNISNNIPNYELIYKGDVTNLVGFIRMPINKYLNGYSINATRDLSNEKRVIVKYLDTMIDNEGNIKRSYDNISMMEPDKYIVYVFNNKGEPITHNQYKQYLKIAVPSINDIIEYVNEISMKMQNKVSFSRIMTLLSSLDYYLSSEYLLSDKKTTGLHYLTYNEYETLKELLDDELELQEDINKHLTKKLKMKKEKKQIIQHKIVPLSIIELCNEVYINKITEDDYKYLSDKALINHYRYEIDNGFYFELLLQQHKIDKIKDNKDELQSVLNSLKQKYDSLTHTIGSSEKICSQARKPNILLYDSVEKVNEDNGRIILNSSGQLVKTGDYAYVELEGGEKHLYQRNNLTDGDYWIEQSLDDLVKLQSYATEECKVDKEDKEAMVLDEKRGMCSFDMNKLTCSIIDNNVSVELVDLEEEIKQMSASIDMIERLPRIKDELVESIRKQEDKVRLLYSNINLIKKINLDEVIKQRGETENGNKGRCIHTQAINAIKSMRNITDNEKYMYYQEIINQFQDLDHTNKLNLNIIETENTELNYLNCNVCNTKLMCKHYLWSINQIYNTGSINYEQMKDIYGDEIDGSFYCKVCGVWLVNSDTIDDVKFGKSSGNSGKALIQRDVIEEQEQSLSEKNRLYIEKIIADTLKKDTNTMIKEDIEIRLRIFKLLKQLSGIKGEMLMDDEVAIINYIKSYNYTPKSSFILLIKSKFAGKGISDVTIEKYADKLYKQSYILDLTAIVLIIMQCGNYPVRNKYAGNIIQGFPLFRDSASEMDGINYMARLLIQIAAIFDFMDDWETGGDVIVDKIRGKLITTIKKNMLQDEYLTSKMENALTEQYNDYVFDKERANKESNKLRLFKPLVGRLNWTPDKDIIIVNEGKEGHYVEKRKDIITSQIDYSSMNIISLIYGYVHKLKPENIIYLRSRIMNSAIPINYHNIYSQRKNKYINPDINYYNKIYDNINGIQASINLINKYTNQINTLKQYNEMARIKINSISIFKLNRVNIANGKLYDLNKDELEIVTKKFISTGEYRGYKHIFNKYNTCIISNQKLDALLPVSLSEFPELFKSIQQNHIILLQNKKYTSELIDIINVLRDEPAFKDISDENIELIVLQYLNDTTFANKLYKVIRQYKVFREINEYKILQNKLSSEMKDTELIIVVNILKLLIQVLPNKNDEYSQLATKIKNADIGKVYFKLISNINMLIQNTISKLIEQLGITDNTKKITFENILINLGNMENIISDYKNNIIKQENVINYIYPLNFDKKQEEYTYYIIGNFIEKIFNNIHTLVNMIIYNNWVNETQIQQYHYKQFFKYADNKGIFKSWQNIFRDVSNIYTSMNSIIEGIEVFNYEYIKLIKHYLIIYTLDKILRVDSNKKGTIINVNEPKAFSFYSFVDTNLNYDLQPDLQSSIEEKTIDDTITNIIDYNEQKNNDSINGGSVRNFNSDEKLIERIEKQKVKSGKIAIEFVIDIVEYINGIQTIYNKMNNDNRRRIKDKTSQEQTRMNLDTVKALKKEGFNTDYNIIMQRMKMGSFSYSELYDRVKEQMGDDFVDEYVNEYNSTKGEHHDLGDAEYDPVEAEEIGEVEVVEAEDMEDDHVDYGYMVID